MRITPERERLAAVIRLRYVKTVSRAVLIVVLFSLLFAIPARAAHGCADLAGSATALQSSVDLGMYYSNGDDPAPYKGDGSVPKSGGHCDICGHVSVGAGAPDVVAIPVVVAESDPPRDVGSRQRLSPPLGRPDKPPR